jgi:hypothetical protein
MDRPLGKYVRCLYVDCMTDSLHERGLTDLISMAVHIAQTRSWEVVPGGAYMSVLLSCVTIRYAILEVTQRLGGKL